MGSIGSTGSNSGSKTLAKIGSSEGDDYKPSGIAVDITSTFIVFADASNNIVRKVVIATGVIVNIANSKIF